MIIVCDDVTFVAIVAHLGYRETLQNFFIKILNLVMNCSSIC